MSTVTVCKLEEWVYVDTQKKVPKKLEPMEYKGDELGNGLVLIEGEVDLPFGDYRWDRGKKQFDPIDRKAPSFEEAVHGLIEAASMSGVQVPPVTQAWADWYSKRKR